MAEKRIGSRTFKVDMVLATEAIRLQARIFKLAGGAVDRLPTIIAGAGKDATPEAKAASDAAALGAFADILARCDPDEMARLIGDIVALARVQLPSGTWASANLDTDFIDTKGEIIPVVMFVLKEVFSDFFSGALGSINQLIAKKATSAH